jgi:predicted RNA-binding Zn-ribbon protein involved in translation (DUF1610 family)
MRTITKLRLPAFGLMAAVLVVNLEFLGGWNYPAALACYLAPALWQWRLRCPVCGYIIERPTKRFRLKMIPDTCLHCGADFYRG